jgi:hypothetical protein
MATLSIPVTKGKANVEFDTDALPDAVYQEALRLGLKELANRGMSKVTKAAYPNEEEMKAKAMEVAKANVENIVAGKIKFTGQKASKVSGAVKTEAMRLARNLVKDAIKASGGKISHYEASEITKAAKELLEADQSLLKMAEDNIAAREQVGKTEKIDLSKIAVSDKLVAKAEAKKKASTSTLSATQAGKVKTKSKNKAPTEAAQA